MKLLSLIFGLIVFLLSLLACCQEEDCCAEGKGEKQEASVPAEDSDAEMPCSPFYSCGSCLGFVTEKESGFSLKLPLKYLHSETGYFIQQPLTGFHFFLTKPPAAA